MPSTPDFLQVQRTCQVTLRSTRSSERARAVVELRPLPQDVEPTCSSDELLLRRAVVRLLDRLPLEQRHALVLHHVLEMTVSEIAKELRAPVETVRSRLRLARNKLREFGLAVERKDEPSE